MPPDRQPDTEEQPDPMLDVTWPDRQPDTVPPDRQPDTEEQPDPMLLDVTWPDRQPDTEEEPDHMLDVTWPPSRYGYELLQNLEETCLYIGDWTVKYTQ